MVLGVSSESKEINSDLEKGVDGFVEDWTFDFFPRMLFSLLILRHL